MYLSTYIISTLSALTAAVVVKKDREDTKRPKKKKKVMQTEWDRRLST